MVGITRSKVILFIGYLMLFLFRRTCCKWAGTWEPQVLMTGGESSSCQITLGKSMSGSKQTERDGGTDEDLK